MKKILIHLHIFVCALALAGGASAQDFIDEDLLDNIDANSKTLFSNTPGEFAVNKAPQKWAEESGAILGFSRHITIDKISRSRFLGKSDQSLFFIETVRFKMQMNDNNAVNRFSEIYFRFNEKDDAFAARLIKADGEVTPIVLNEAVGIESSSDIPEFFKSFFDRESATQQHYYKVAVPGLEPGDVLEYAAATKSKMNVRSSGYIEFSPQYEILSKSYPVLYNQISIETDDKSFFKSMSLNGAPEFKKEAGADPQFFRYVFTDRDRATEKDVNFLNPYDAYPYIKFQVIYANKATVKGAMIGAKGELKQGFTKEELAKKAWEEFASLGKQSYDGYVTNKDRVGAEWNALKKAGAKDWTEKDFVAKAYYSLRNTVVNRSTYLPDKTWAYLFGALLFQRDIPTDLIITTSNKAGKLKDVLFDEEIRYAIRYKDVIYYNPTDHTNPGENVETMLGNDAYVIKEPAKDGSHSITPIKLPDMTSDNSQQRIVINVSLLPDSNRLVVSRNNTYTGIFKNRYIDDALKYVPYALDDYRYYGGTDPSSTYTGRAADDYYASLKAYKDELKELKPEWVKRELKSEFGNGVQYQGFKVISDGRGLKKPDLTYVEEFMLDGLVRRAGNKILVNLTGLVGSPLQIKKDELDRKYEMNLGYARSLQWIMNFTVPEGYTVEGLTELATEINNAAGKYTSSAKAEGNTVVLTIQKTYNRSRLSLDAWKDMVSFVTTAYNDSYKYILLKPKS